MIWIAYVYVFGFVCMALYMLRIALSPAVNDSPGMKFVVVTVAAIIWPFTLLAFIWPDEADEDDDLPYC